jgi:hypothetical protein
MWVYIKHNCKRQSFGHSCWVMWCHDKDRKNWTRTALLRVVECHCVAIICVASFKTLSVSQTVQNGMVRNKFIINLKLRVSVSFSLFSSIDIWRNWGKPRKFGFEAYVRKKHIQNTWSELAQVPSTLMILERTLTCAGGRKAGRT